MSSIPKQFRLDLKPVATDAASIYAGKARFTLLTERLIRLEYHPEGHFEDRPSQTMWFREQPVPDFQVEHTQDGVNIQTDYLTLRYHDAELQGLTRDTLSIEVAATGVVWQPGDVDADNLLGTTRTLDFINGYTPLGQGLMSRAGWALLDDSLTLVFNPDYWIEPRQAGGTDVYFFGYGHDYKACLQDYCRVSGKPPLIPRWILGNWWSRFWAYTQDELMQLVSDFEAHDIPLSVCIVDMDWHLTETGNDSTGWTGYTWNRKLFPDPDGLIRFFHDKGLKTGFNLHPAEGIHSHEAQYAEMARRMGIDPETKQPVAFDITDPRFVEAYFEVLHHPYEKMGVDFWWLDWQQGLTSNIPGLDPLWLINHLHFHDRGRDGTRRPFIFSRWGNEGHQRYPIGFSGDSYVTWDTLRFEAYMTATATNIAYGWWSHDIGGHTSGMEDSELFTRWVQFGVFNPIMRIHVTKGMFYDRRPWMYEDAEVLHVLREALQLRHAMLPYLYTMAHRAHDDSLPLVQPMYYDYPDDDAAYHCPHQYLFGTEMVAAPFVAPADADTGLSRQVMWLPEGDWYHVFSGEHFAGDSWYPIYGKLKDIPVFAKAGAIVPFGPTVGWGGVDNPEALHIHLFAGADHTFTLYEDDGETLAFQDGHYCETQLAQTWADNRLEFTMDAPTGDTSLIPAERMIHLSIHGVKNARIRAAIDGQTVSATGAYDAPTETLHLTEIPVKTGAALRVVIESEHSTTLLSWRDRKRETLLRLLKAFRLHTGVRNELGDKIDAIIADPDQIAPYLITMTESQARALCEILYEAGLHYVRDTYRPTLLVLWNNQADDQITYRYGDAYLFFGSVRSANHERNTAPRFKAFTPAITTWRHGALEENVQRTQWMAQLDYHGLLVVTEQHVEDSP